MGRRNLLNRRNHFHLLKSRGPRPDPVSAARPVWAGVLGTPRCLWKGCGIVRTIDFSPIFRSSVGFDRMAQMLDHHLHAETSAQTSYPPYNIERVNEDNYRITMAVAGFDREDVTVTAQDNGLVVAGRHSDAADDNGAAGKFSPPRDRQARLSAAL